MGKLIPDMSKMAMEKLLVVGLAAVRKVCEDKDIDFLEIVSKAMKSKITTETINQVIDAFDEDSPEDFLKYLEDDSDQGGGPS